jgi:hypothetical protein
MLDYFKLIFQLTDICAKINQRCAIGGELFVDEEFIAAVDAKKVTYPEFNSSTRGVIYYAPRLGGLYISKLSYPGH